MAAPSEDVRRSPSLVPDAASVSVHMVLDDFGRLGRAWREMGEESTSERDIIREIGPAKWRR
jgi:hypothetical protein